MLPEEAGENVVRAAIQRRIAVNFLQLPKTILKHHSIGSPQRLDDNGYLPLGLLTSLPSRDIPAEQKAS